MRIDDLTRELRAQAEETRSWPMPAAPQPARRRHRRRRDAVLVLVSVVAVTAIVGFPKLIDRDTTTGLPADRPSAASSPTAIPQWHEWTAVRCPSRARTTCAVPWIIKVFAGEYASGTGGQQPVFEGAVISPNLKLRLHGRPAGRLVLVGATRPGPHSRLTARVGDEAPVQVDGDLALIWLPRSTGPLDVRVAEDGVPAARETLVIQENRPLRNTGG